MLDFEHSILGMTEPRAVARQSAERSIDQRRRDVYESHRHRAFSLAYYMTRNELAAEDLLARCFTRAFAGSAFAGEEEPDGTAVDAALLKELRADGLLEEPETQESSAQALSAALSAARAAGQQPGGNIRRTDLEESLGELAPMERLIFLLSDVEGYRAAAIAPLLGKSVAEISCKLMCARLHLRQAVAALQKKREK